MPGPGNRFGQDVTMRQRRLLVCAIAGVASALAKPTAPPRASARRVILFMKFVLNEKSAITLF
jgi:hypothetical protein